MKKKALFVSLLGVLLCSSCGGTTTTSATTSKAPSTSQPESSSTSTTSGGSYVPGKRLPNGLFDFGPDFKEKYYPDLTKVDQSLSGKVDVVIVFDDTEKGWKAVADEYVRIHEDAVVISLNNQYDSSTYKDKVRTELNAATTDWDIIQGNLTGGLTDSTHCVNMYSDIYDSNAYAGGSRWDSVLEEDAYITDKTGTNTDVFMLNSENLQTAFFVNTVALAAARDKGYNYDHNPETWDQLVELCAAMVEAGYSNPLGLSLDKDSLGSTQFTWLLRIYGDYYYRNEYNQIAEDYGEYEVDLTSENPEGDPDYQYNVCSLFNVILDDTTTERDYVGAKSDKFGEFLSQFVKIRQYINKFNVKKSFGTVRDEFQTQVNGKDSPQILLDYAGRALSFNNFIKEEQFNYDFFDYPKMISEGGFIEENTLLRDVGGNGGYLSVVKHESSQNKMIVDFLKFFMSPYGQSVYYEGLKSSTTYPQGITLVKNNLVIIPEAWKEFFATTKITFTGLSDSNPFLTFLVRYLAQGTNTTTASIKLWGDLMADYTKEVMEDFQIPWHTALMADWEPYANSQLYDLDCYKRPGGNPRSGK